MTFPAPARRERRWGHSAALRATVALVAMLTVLVVGLAGNFASVASARTLRQPETRVGASAADSSQIVGTHEPVLAGQRRARAPSYDPVASGSCVAAENEGLVNLASEGRTTHILEGDATGGGHQWPGLSGKSPFPEDWSAGRIMHEISDVATDPAASRVVQGGRTVVTGSRGGVDIRVIVDNNTGEIITGYPTNLPRNP
ncbi:MAG: EndoU domain-containing protein [Actinomycetota bacterium]|nr:EndoU domain-containing protein [Actinomycetota bacterium]